MGKQCLLVRDLSISSSCVQTKISELKLELRDFFHYDSLNMTDLNRQCVDDVANAICTEHLIC